MPRNSGLRAIRGYVWFCVCLSLEPNSIPPMFTTQRTRRLRDALFIYLSTVQNRSYPRSSSPIKSIWQEKQTIITPILPPSGTFLYCGTAIGGHAPEPLSFFGFLMSEHRTRGFGVLRASSRFFVYKGRESRIKCAYNSRVGGTPQTGPKPRQNSEFSWKSTI